MDGGQVPGRRGDGVVVPTVVAALMGGIGVLAVAITGAWGFSDSLSTSGTSAAVRSPATASRPARWPTSRTDGPVVPPSPVTDAGSVVPVEASTAPAPIQVTPDLPSR